MRTFCNCFALLALVGGSLSFANAAEIAPPQRSSAQSQLAGTQANEENLDNQIAACMLLGNQEEAALGQYAEQHAQHEQVKKFAMMLVEHHGKAVAMIQQAAPEVADLQLTIGESESSSKPAPSPQGAAASDRSIDMIQQVKGQCLALTQKELDQYQGTEFDKAFIGQQLGAHLGMLAQLRGSKNFASPELQKVIAEGEKMTIAHMVEAKKIMAEIKDLDSKTASANTGTAASKR